MKLKKIQQKYGPWAIVTGASAGIGTEFARQIAAKGLNIVLAARRAEKLETLATEFQKAHKIETRFVPLDLTPPGFETTLQEATADLEIGLLVNNAGAAELGDFAENSLESELRIVDLNARAPMILSHLYAQKFIEQGRGGIMILSSMLRLVGVFRYANYAATKGYDLLLAEGLAKEFRPQGADIIGVAPEFTESEYTSGMDVSKMPIQMPFIKDSDTGEHLASKVGNTDHASRSWFHESCDVLDFPAFGA